MKTVLFFLMSFCTVLPGQAQQYSAATRQTRNIRLIQGQPLSVTLSLDSNKAYVLNCEQKGIDAEIFLISKAGDTVGYKDSPNGKYGAEILEITPPSDGIYTWKVQALKQAGNSDSGTVALSWQEKRPLPPPQVLNRWLSAAEMQRDLAAFRKIRTEANSGLYRYRSRAQIDSIYTWAASQSRTRLRLTDFYKIILTLTDFEGSNHNSTNLPEPIDAYLSAGTHYVPFYAKFVDGGMVMNTDSLSIPVGSRIVSVNGRDETQLRKDFSKYYTTDGYNQTRKHKATAELSFGWRYLLEYGPEDSFRIRFVRPYATAVEEVTLPAISKTEKGKRNRERYSLPFDSTISADVQPKYSFRMVTPKTGLLSIRVFDMASGDDDPAYAVYCRFLDSTFAALRQNGVKNLIVDIRNNPGGSGSNAETTFRYLTAGQPFRENTGAHILFQRVPKPELFRWSSTDKNNQQREQEEREKYLQSVFNRRDGNWWAQDTSLAPLFLPAENRFRGKIVLLVDENVGSAASHFASEVKGHSDATVMGMETTGGYYGHNGHYPVEYLLPASGIITRFSIVWVDQDAPYRPDQPFGRGIIPHITVSQSLDDFLRQEDTQLKAALRFCEP